MGITNEGFQQERDETPSCQFATVPNDVNESVSLVSAISNFANFQRFLAPPIPSTNTPGGSDSINRGRQQFTNVGCVHCHTPSLPTSANSTVAALSGKTANLYSDLALHQMGPNLADDILQGVAKGDEFRTAPLWGLGKRIFFLHDGRTKDLDEAIQAHKSGGQQQVRRVGGERRDRPVQPAARKRSAGSAELPAFALVFPRSGRGAVSTAAPRPLSRGPVGGELGSAQSTGAGARGIVSHCAGSCP